MLTRRAKVYSSSGLLV